MRNLILAFLAGFLVCIASIALDELLYEWAEYQRPESGYFTREAENGICDEEDIVVPGFKLWEAGLEQTNGMKIERNESHILISECEVATNSCNS